MKSRIAWLVIFLFCSFAQSKSATAGREVTVDLELEEFSNASLYEIEVKKAGSSPLNYSQKEAQFHLRLNAGNYQVRTRIVSRQNETGPWSDWTELLANPETVKLQEPPAFTLPVRKDREIAGLDLNWQPAAGAAKYIVWVEDLTTKKTLKETVKKESVSLKLQPGEYRIGIQSVSKDGLKSEVKYFENSFFVARTKLPEIQVSHTETDEFSWERQAEADVKIEIYRKPFFGEQYLKMQSVRQTGSKWILPRGLPPGEYRLEFQYISEAFENGPVHTLQFVKKPGENNFRQPL